jgi:hypothetical protein
MNSSGQEDTSRQSDAGALAGLLSPVEVNQQANGVAEETFFDRQSYGARV